MADDNRFKIFMENAVRPFMENKPAVYLLLLLCLTTGTYTVNDLIGRAIESEIPGVVVPEPEPVHVPTPNVKPVPNQIIREIIRQPADCQPLIDKSVTKHEKKKHD